MFARFASSKAGRYAMSNSGTSLHGTTILAIRKGKEVVRLPTFSLLLR
jgi:hypothetical protein